MTKRTIDIDTNLYRYRIDMSAFKEHFSVLELTVKRNRYYHDFRSIDLAGSSRSICSFSFHYADTDALHYLVLCQTGSQDETKQKILKTDGSDDLNVNRINADVLSDQNILKLLINAVPSLKRNTYLTNLNGSLFRFKRRTRTAAEAYEISAAVKPDSSSKKREGIMLLKVTTRTFGRRDIVEKQSSRGEKIRFHNCYIIDGGCMVRCFTPEKYNAEDIYCLHGLKDRNGSQKRAGTNFIDYSSDDAFIEESRLYQYLNMEADIRDVLSEMLEIMPCPLSCTDYFDGRKLVKQSALRNQALSSLFKEDRLGTVDICISDDEWSEQEKDAIVQLKQAVELMEMGDGKYFKVNGRFRFVSSPDPEIPCIFLIHNAEYYERNKAADPYGRYAWDLIQHLTVEELAGSTGDKIAKNQLAACLFNLEVKKDIHEGRLHAADIGRHAIDAPWFFLCRIDPDHEMIMRLNPDGTFCIDNFKLIADKEECYPVDTDMLKDILQKDKTAECIAIQPSAAAVISKTDIIAVPHGGDRLIEEFEKIQSHPELPKFRAGKNADIFYRGVTNVFYHQAEDGNVYYSVGFDAKDLRSSYAAAVHFRKIRIVSGSVADLDAFMNVILPEPDEVFIRNGRLSVLPFPMHYCRARVGMDEAEIKRQQYKKTSEH